MNKADELSKESDNRELDDLLIELFDKWKEYKQEITGFPKSDEAQVEAFLEIISERLPYLLISGKGD
jgi:hypothetical protein